MAIPLDSIPSFTPDEARELALRFYGLDGEITALPSERDQNFCVGAASGKMVVKIANRRDVWQLIELQNQAMRHVALHAADCCVPRILCSVKGRDIEFATNRRTGATHCMRVLNWLDGEVLAATATRDPGLLDSIGAALARLDTALGSFEHPAMHRVLQWDLRRADLAREHIGLLSAARRGQVEGLFARWRAIDWTQLRFGAIHGDANDHNLLVQSGRMVGMLDFGDMVHSAVICDLAIALAYVMLGDPEPVSAASRVSRAYQRHYPLHAAEQLALYPLILSRLAMSVCYSAHNRSRNPADLYQVVSEASAWELLGRLQAHSFGSVQAALGAGCAQ